MPLPTRSLDDRRFQDIVDEAKRLIPRYCPEWTDHNVSDPGVAMIELFAWMTDMLLYRVNQVPDRMYVKFLELIGVRLEPPRAANAPVTFYLSAPQPVEITIPEGTEVATVRTETSPAIVFTTASDLVIRPASLVGVFTRSANRTGDSAWTSHDLRQLEVMGQRASIFPLQPAPGDAFYLGLGRDHGSHVLAVVMDCEVAGGAGVDPHHPPLEWQVWQGGTARWAPCDVEYDGTGGFNWSGEIILRLPPMAETSFNGLQAYWLRCRLTSAQGGENAYQVSPRIRGLRVESRGGTAPARHATTVLNEVLGRSDGTPGQQFALLQTPLLARDPRRDFLVVELATGEVEPWQEVLDFADSGPDDRHYTLDSLEGQLAFGPSLLQPEGSVRQFGAIPPRDSLLRFVRYQSGGGTIGNVSRGALSVPKSSIPYVTRVTNWQEAQGGRDAQSLENAMLRAPQFLRTRTRAVTADDYEYLASQVEGAARAACLAPGAQPGLETEPRPGQVVVVVLPQAGSPGGRIPPEMLSLSAELHGKVLAHLDQRRVLGTSLEVRAPRYTWVSVRATLRLRETADRSLAAQAQQQAEAELYRYLNPYVGGPRGDGWPFGRDLHISEINSLLQRLPSVEYVEQVALFLSEPGNAAAAQPAGHRIALPPEGLVCSEQHQVQAV